MRPMVDNITGSTGPLGPRPNRPQPGMGPDGRPLTAQGAVEAVLGRPAVRDQVTIMGVPEDELTANVRNALHQSMSEIVQLRGENERLKARLKEVENLADNDPLVPVLNRRAFTRELNKAVSYADRYNGQASLVYIDMNNFKAINDVHGHAAGDAAIKQVAETLNQNIRESDVVGRLGGDEFGVILAAAGDDAARVKAQALADAIAANPVYLPDGQSVTLSISFGVQTFAKGGDAEAIMAAADAEMFIAKRVNANRGNEGV